MLSTDDRSRNPFGPQSGLNPSTPASSVDSFTVPLPGMSGPLEQEGTHRLPVQFSPVSTPQLPFPNQTRQLALPNQSGMTRILSGTLEGDQGSTTARQRLVIKGEMKKGGALPVLPYAAHKKRRLVVSLVGVLILLLITSGTLFAASPMGHELGMNFNPQQFSSNLITNQNPNVSSLVAQATATAVYYRQNDGYDPYAYGGQTVGNGAGSLSWPVGQCTYWSNSRYHTLSGFWVPWNGNADQWVAGAQKAGWNVSQTNIHVPSIIVLMPYVQGASGYGHVAVVESATGNVAHTSNMNWWANGGGWNRVSNVDFTTGTGVYFVWHS